MPIPAIIGGLAAAALSVYVHMAVDSGVASPALARQAQTEASAIWSPYGIELLWNDDDGRADLRLDAMVERRPPRSADPADVLARVNIASDDRPPAPIHISLDAIDGLLERFYSDHPGFRDYMLGTALGRVLAHELGHVLLGSPGFHERVGLMRARFPADDLARLERSRFRLGATSLLRLRARLEVLVSDQPCQ